MAKTKRIELKDSGVIFNEERHTYLFGDKYLSGITGMLQRQFFPSEFEESPKTYSMQPLNMELTFIRAVRTSI